MDLMTLLFAQVINSISLKSGLQITSFILRTLHLILPMVAIEMIVHDRHVEPWKVTIVDTGLLTMTGGRLKRVQQYLGAEPFMMTYGDGVCDVNIKELVDFHKKHGKIATLTSVQEIQQKGVLDIAYDNSVRSFREKKQSMVNISMQVIWY